MRGMQAIVEITFDVVYLITVIAIGVRMMRMSQGNKQYHLFGAMAIVLGLGDAFHLVPRAVALCTTGLDNFTVALGMGKFITSITMTIFYVLLYFVWRVRYGVQGRQVLTAVIFGLSALRIILCLFPPMVVMLMVRGVFQVMGSPMTRARNASISGIAGITHILMAASFVLLYLSMRNLKKQ